MLTSLPLELDPRNRPASLTHKNWPASLLKNRLWHSCFPVNFTKFLRIPFLKEHLWWLLL